MFFFGVFFLLLFKFNLEVLILLINLISNWIANQNLDQNLQIKKNKKIKNS